MANVLVTVSVQNQTGPVPLDGVTVRVYQSDGTTFVTEGVTGAPFAAGVVEFTLFGDSPAVDYVLRLSLDGWQFPAGATVTISVEDPPAPSNDFGPYDAVQGPSAPLVRFIVSDDQNTPQPIDGVVVRVYSSPADAFLAEGETGAGAEDPGTVSMALAGSPTPGTDYIVRLSKPGVTFSPNPTQTVSVEDPLTPPDTNDFDFTGSVATLPTSLDPDLCRITGVLTDVSLRPLQGRVVRFIPPVNFPTGPRYSAHFTGNPTLLRDNALLAPVQVVTDSNGRIDVELPRGGVYEVHIHGFEHPMVISELMRVPDEAAYSFLDLLWPFVQEVQFSVDPITIDSDTDEFVEVEITVLSSNGQVIEDFDLLDYLLEFTIDDGTVASVKLTDDKTLTVSVVAPGTTNIQVARKDGTVAPRRPDVPDLIFTAPQVVVT